MREIVPLGLIFALFILALIHPMLIPPVSIFILHVGHQGEGADPQLTELYDDAEAALLRAIDICEQDLGSDLWTSVRQAEVSLDRPIYNQPHAD